MRREIMASDVAPDVPVEFSAVITCYQEADSIREFHGRLRGTLERLGRSFEIVYVNDGSTDATLQVLWEIYASDPGVESLIDLAGNYGPAAAVAAGCVAARGRHFIFLDSDLQLDPEELPLLMGEFDKGVDLVNGVRHRRRDHWLRRNVSRMFNACLRWISGARVADLGCTFKVVRGTLIRSLVTGPQQALNPVHLAATARSCSDVPVSHHPRRYGTSGWSLSMLLTFAAGTIVGLYRPKRSAGPACYVIASCWSRSSGGEVVATRRAASF